MAFLAIHPEVIINTDQVATIRKGAHCIEINMANGASHIIDDPNAIAALSASMADILDPKILLGDEVKNLPLPGDISPPVIDAPSFWSRLKSIFGA